MPSLEPRGENVAGSSRGYRNGTYRRNLATATGREGQFHTQAFERYSRYEPHIAED